MFSLLDFLLFSGMVAAVAGMVGWMIRDMSAIDSEVEAIVNGIDRDYYKGQYQKVSLENEQLKQQNWRLERELSEIYDDEDDEGLFWDEEDLDDDDYDSELEDWDDEDDGDDYVPDRMEHTPSNSPDCPKCNGDPDNCYPSQCPYQDASNVGNEGAEQGDFKGILTDAVADCPVVDPPAEYRNSPLYENGQPLPPSDKDSGQ